VAEVFLSVKPPIEGAYCWCKEGPYPQARSLVWAACLFKKPLKLSQGLGKEPLMTKRLPCHCWRCSERRCYRSWWLRCTTSPGATHPGCLQLAQRMAHPTGVQFQCHAACLVGRPPKRPQALRHCSWPQMWRRTVQPVLVSSPPCAMH